MGRAKEMMYDMELERQEERLADALGIDRGTLQYLHYDMKWTESVFPELVIIFLEGSDEETMEMLDLSIGDELRFEGNLLDSSYDYEDVDEWLVDPSDKYTIFLTHINSVEQLARISLDNETHFHLLVMLHAHVVAAIESYLASTYIRHVVSNPELMRKAIESDPHFNEQKVSISEIFKTVDNIKDIVVKRLKDIIFHRIDVVKPMYKAVFNYDFGDVKWLFKAVAIRHDCTHRAGFDKDEKKVNVSTDSVLELTQNCRDLCYEIEKHVKQFSGDSEGF